MGKIPFLKGSVAVLICTLALLSCSSSESSRKRGPFSSLSKEWLETQKTSLEAIQHLAGNEQGMKIIFSNIEKISKEIKKPAKFAKLQHHRPKNRHEKFIPFDENRTCRELPGFYISGSDIYTPEQHYIVTQGPLNETVQDFWQALLHRKCKLIVTTTMHIEGGREKCASYWKKHLPTQVLDYTISLYSEKTLFEKPMGKGELKHRIVKRVFAATSPDDKKYITQLHYENWPDLGVPDLETFLFLLKTIERMEISKNSPITVHCSAGIGRSGTFVAAHSLWKKLRSEKKKDPSEIFINVPERVMYLRTQRNYLVSTPQQLQTVYQTLASEL